MESEHISNVETSKSKPFVFNDQEVSQIRQSLAGKGNIPDVLLTKVENDPLFAECSTAMFFPMIGERIQQSGEIPELSGVRTIGRNGALKVSFNQDSFMIKTIENSQEPVIAKSVAEIGVGPKQFESIDGYVTEEFIEGDTLNKLDPDKCTPKYMENIGQKLASAIKKVHDKNILINDQLLSDDNGKSHTIITSEGDVRFIDFGSAVDLTNFPNISDEAVKLIIRSDTFASMTLMMISPEKLPDFINHYRQDFLSKLKTSKEVIEQYDAQLINEGFFFLSQRLPNIEHLINGFNQVTV
jgi:tRNA A-37 threonylcarbamoyl transferase component Bud32